MTLNKSQLLVIPSISFYPDSYYIVPTVEIGCYQLIPTKYNNDSQLSNYTVSVISPITTNAIIITHEYHDRCSDIS